MYSSGGQPEEEPFMELKGVTRKLNAYFSGHQPGTMGTIKRLVNMDSFSGDGEDMNKVGKTAPG